MYNGSTLLLSISLTLVLQWYFLYACCKWEGVNDPPGVSQGSVPPKDKIPKAPMFSRVSFSTIPMLTLYGDSFTPKFKMAPKIGSSFTLARVVVFECIWVDYFLLGKLNAIFLFRPQFILMSHFNMPAEKHHNHIESEIVYMQTQ